MDERRIADRRQSPRGGRRASDAPHGTRRKYQSGCDCRPCRCAEAAYRSALRRARLEGKQPLGVKVSARSMWRLIESLRIEGYTYAAIARKLGLQSPQIQLHTDTVTLRNLLKVRALYRAIMLDGIEEGGTRAARASGD